MNYDLEERTARFGENVIEFAKSIPQNVVNTPLISQLVRSATSVGANYMEANQASSKKDFYHKIRISLKESNETKHWVRMISQASQKNNARCKKLWQEAHELTLIFSKIVRAAKK